MSLIKCPECGKEVSDKADLCPNCGYSISDYIDQQLQMQQVREEEERNKIEIEKLKKNISLPEEPQQPQEPYTMVLSIVSGVLLIIAGIWFGFIHYRIFYVDSDAMMGIMVCSVCAIVGGGALLVHSSTESNKYTWACKEYQIKYNEYIYAKDNPDIYKQTLAENKYYARKYGIFEGCPVCRYSDNSAVPISKWKIDLINGKAICETCNHTEPLNNIEINSHPHIQPANNSNQYSKPKPKCPTCGSENIEKISIASKAAGGVAFGLYSSNVRKTFHCKDCGYKW